MSSGDGSDGTKDAAEGLPLLVSKDMRSPPFGIGRVMPITEAGYLRVAARRNDSEMETFIRRVLHQKGLDVADEQGLQGFARFFSGTRAVQSLADLKSGLTKVPWVVAQKQEAPIAHDNNAFVDEASFQKTLEHGTEEELKALIRNMLWHEQRHVLQKHEFVNFVRTLKGRASSSKSLQEVQQHLREASWAQPSFEARNLLKRGGSEHGAELSEWSRSSPMANEALALGNVAPLTEKGYQQVTAAQSDEEMKRFIRRVIAKDGGEITNEGELSGLVGFYSGSRAVQSMAALQNELASASWVQRSSHMSAPAAGTEDASLLHALAFLHQGGQVIKKSNDTEDYSATGTSNDTNVDSAAGVADTRDVTGQTSVVISGNGAVTEEALPPMPRFVSTAEESLHKLQDVAWQMKDKALQDYEKRKAKLQETRTAYQADLEVLQHRNTEFVGYLGTLQENISSLEAKNYRDRDGALALQAQNHARLQVMRTLKDRLATTVSFLEDAEMVNQSVRLDEHIAERQDFDYFLKAAREELGLMNNSYFGEQFSSASLLQVGTSPNHGLKSEGAFNDQFASDEEGGGLETDHMSAAHELVMSLSPALATVSKATESAREILQTNYETSVNMLNQKYESLEGTRKNMVQRQQDAVRHQTDLAEAKAKLNSIKGAVGDRISWLKLFMTKSADVAHDAAADAARILQENM